MVNDGVYNIRGHVVEIRNGIRVSPVRSQSNNQHMRNSSASEGTKNDYSRKVQHDSHAKNSIYSGREYLLGHLSDLSSGKDKTAVRSQIRSQSQIEGGDETGTKARGRENLTAKSEPKTHYGAGQDAIGGWASDSGTSAQHSGSGLSTIDSLEVDTLQETQSRNVDLKRKSSLKRRQPPGSPTKEKRKVKFNSSIEFNDGFIWLLNDSEEKPKNGLIRNKVVTGSSSALTKKNLVVTGQNRGYIITNDSNQAKDYSYPETVDLGLPNEIVMGRADSEKYDKTFEEHSTGNLEGDTNTEQTPDGCLFDSLEVDHEASKHNCDFDAVARDSLELGDDEGEKQGLHVAACHDSQGNRGQADRQGTEQQWHDQYSTDINGNKSKEIFLKEGDVESGETCRGDLDSYSLVNTGIVSTDIIIEPRMNSSGYVSRAAGLRDSITHGDVSFHKTYESSIQASSLQGTNTTVNRHYIPCTATGDDSDHHQSISYPSTPSHQIDAEKTSKGHGSTIGYTYVASKKPSYNEPDDDNSTSIKYNSTAVTSTGQPSFQDPYFDEQKLQRVATVIPHARQQESSFIVPNSYSSSSTRTLQDGYGYSCERQPAIDDVCSRISEDVDKSEVHRHHMDTLLSRSYIPKDQHEVLSSKSAMLQKQANIAEDPTVAQGADLHAWKGSTTDSHLTTRQNSVSSLARDATLISQNKPASAESDNEDELIKKVRKSMAELQFSSNWRPESAGALNQDQSTVSQDNIAGGMPRPTNRAKTMHAELVGDEDKIKAQSKLTELTENAGKKSSIPVRVKNSPTVDLSRQTKTVIAPRKAGIVPHPPKGPRGLFTRKGSRQSPQAQRNSPMRVIQPYGHANQGTQIVENLGVDGRLFSVEASATATVHNGGKGVDRAESKNYQQGVDNAALQGNIHLTGNSSGNTDLNRTPTDDEINELWYNVRNCLTAKPPAKASSDSVYIAPPWKQNRTWSGTTRGRSTTSRKLSLHSAPSTQGYPLRRYGSQDNLIRRENSLDNLVESSSSRGRSAAILAQRPSKARINTNFQAFTVKNSPIHKPYQSEKAPEVSKAKSNDSKLYDFLLHSFLYKRQVYKKHEAQVRQKVRKI